VALKRGIDAADKAPPGNLGNIDLQFGFKPPSGAGLTVDSTSGTFLSAAALAPSACFFCSSASDTCLVVVSTFFSAASTTDLPALIASASSFFSVSIFFRAS
jgi:hypothetical protein